MQASTYYFKQRKLVWATGSLLILAFTCASAQQADTSRHKEAPRTLLLQEVQVKPTKTIAEANKNVRHNSVQELTDQLLERTPGVNMIRRGNFAMEPTIRGLSNGQITMSIDGMRIFGACTDRMDPVSSYVEPNNLQSFSVVDFPGSNGYGSGIGGGIDFKLKMPTFSSGQKWSGLFGSGFETNGNAFQTLGGLEYSSEHFALQANGIFRRSGNYEAADGETISFSQYRKWNGSISTTLKAGEHSYFKADYLQDEGYDIGYPALTMDVAFAKAKIGAVSFVHDDPGARLRWESKLYYNTIDHAMDDTRRPPETVPMHMDMPGRSETFGGFSALNFRIRNRHYLKVQADGFQNSLNATMTMYPPAASPMFMYTLADPVRRSVGLNISDAISLSNKLVVSPGIRLEYVNDRISSTAGEEQLSGMFTGDLSRRELVTNATLEARYHPSPHLTITASVARGARTPTLQETYAFYIYNRPDSYDYIGNPDLEQERSVNLSYSTFFHSSAVEAEVNVFGYFMKNYITGTILGGYSTMTIGANGVKQYVNLPSAQLYGTEIALRYKPTEKLSLSSVNTFTKGTDNSGFALPLIAPFKTVNSVAYRGKKTTYRLEAITNAAQKDVSTEIYGETTTPGSTIVNFMLGRELSLSGHGKINVSAGVDNLLDERYFQHLDIQKIARPGRNITFRTTWLF